MNFNSFQNFYVILSLIFCFCTSCGLTISPEKSIAVPEIQSMTQKSRNEGQMLPITARASISETIIDLEVAKTPAQQSMGLMFRDALPDNRGMYFPLGQSRIARFWMNNVPVALDMVFLQGERVVAIATAPPCTTEPENCPLYGPDEVVDGVIELRAGRAKELGLSVGDTIEIRYLDTLQQN